MVKIANFVQRSDIPVVISDGILTTNNQPLPVRNNGKPVWDLVIEDMIERDKVGRERYGTPLQAHNGRDALQDAYEEALDLAVYLKQEIEERKNK